MILIADCGGTKSHWRTIAGDGSVEQYETAGINPYYQSEEEIASIISGLGPKILGDVEEIFFYGAGCSSDENQHRVRRALTTTFLNASIEVNHDLIAAARALCGDSAGIACILGTGVNSCLYDGKKIIANVPSLGYILGDEGSGFYLGRKLLGDFIRKELPSDLAEKLQSRYNINREDILSQVYHGDSPAKYVASFTKFIFDNRTHQHLHNLVHHGFSVYFTKNVTRYEGYKNEEIHFVGSVAFYFNEILREVAAERGLTLKNIVENPIAGLTLFHSRTSEI